MMLDLKKWEWRKYYFKSEFEKHSCLSETEINALFNLVNLDQLKTLLKARTHSQKYFYIDKEIINNKKILLEKLEVSDTDFQNEIENQKMIEEREEAEFKIQQAEDKIYLIPTVKEFLSGKYKEKTYNYKNETVLLKRQYQNFVLIYKNKIYPFFEFKSYNKFNNDGNITCVMLNNGLDELFIHDFIININNYNYYTENELN